MQYSHRRQNPYEDTSIKKVLHALIFISFALHAHPEEVIESTQQAALAPVMRASLELKAKEHEIQRRIDQEAAEQSDSVPDFFGVFHPECLLPETLHYYEQPDFDLRSLTRLASRPVLREVLNVNWLGILHQRSAELPGIVLVGERYQVSKFLVAGQDIRVNYSLRIVSDDSNLLNAER